MAIVYLDYTAAPTVHTNSIMTWNLASIESIHKDNASHEHRIQHIDGRLTFGPAQPHTTSAETGPNWWASEV